MLRKILAQYGSGVLYFGGSQTVDVQIKGEQAAWDIPELGSDAGVLFAIVTSSNYLFPKASKYISTKNAMNTILESLSEIRFVDPDAAMKDSIKYLLPTLIQSNKSKYDS